MQRRENTYTAHARTNNYTIYVRPKQCERNHELNQAASAFISDDRRATGRAQTRRDTSGTRSHIWPTDGNRQKRSHYMPAHKNKKKIHTHYATYYFITHASLQSLNPAITFNFN